jgi:hypothetical protein
MRSGELPGFVQPQTFLPLSLAYNISPLHATILARRHYEMTAIGSQECAYTKFWIDNASQLAVAPNTAANTMN